MNKYIIPVRIDLTKYQLTRRVLLYATNELEAIEKASIFAYSQYCHRKGFDGCYCLHNCICSESCTTSFCD